jgi:hypothetical protein
MNNKKRATKGLLTDVQPNPYLSWPVGDATLKAVLKHPLPHKSLINSNEGQKVLRDILS